MAGTLLGQLIFLLSLIASGMIGLVTLSYAAHGYLAIVEDTGAGGDDIRWPDDALTDFLWKPFYLAWVWAVPVVATWFGVQALAPELFDGPLGVFITAGGSLWLLFPIFMLSSLSGRSRVQVLHLGLLFRLVRHAGSMLLFYLLTGPVLAAGMALAFIGLFGSGWWLLISVPACVALFFIHARLLGRMAWLISQGKPDKQTGKKKKRKRLRPLASNDPWAVGDQDEEASEDEDMSDVATESSTQIVAGDPRSLPGPQAIKAGLPAAPSDEEEDEWDPHKKPYALADAGSTWPKPERPADTAIAPEDVIAAEPAGADPIGHDQVFPVDPLYLARQERPPPRFALFSNVWNFPVYGNSLRPFVSLTLLGLLLAFFLRLLVMTWPA